MAWALLFPHRQILFMFIFPLPARVAALLMGAMSFMAAAGGVNSSVAEATHLAGFVIGWLYLKGFSRLRPDFNFSFSYWLARWRMERVRRKFNVHKGGKDGWGNTSPLILGPGLGLGLSTDIQHERVLHRFRLVFGPRRNTKDVAFTQHLDVAANRDRQHTLQHVDPLGRLVRVQRHQRALLEIGLGEPVAVRADLLA